MTHLFFVLMFAAGGDAFPVPCSQVACTSKYYQFKTKEECEAAKPVVVLSFAGKTVDDFKCVQNP